jgi:predicted nuclease with TOPRIM domain
VNLTLRTQKSELRSQNSELRTQNSELRTQISDLRTQISDLRSQNSELTTPIPTSDKYSVYRIPERSVGMKNPMKEVLKGIVVRMIRFKSNQLHFYHSVRITKKQENSISHRSCTEEKTRRLAGWSNSSFSSLVIFYFLR